MNDELRAAAERLRNPYPRASVSGGKYWDSYYMHIQEMIDLRKVADAYLAECDETPVTVEWMQSIGFVMVDFGKWHHARNGSIRFFSNNEGVMFGIHNSWFMNKPTRGDVRILFRALHLSLAESPQGN